MQPNLTSLFSGQEIHVNIVPANTDPLECEVTGPGLESSHEIGIHEMHITAKVRLLSIVFRVNVVIGAVISLNCMPLWHIALCQNGIYAALTLEVMQVISVQQQQ